MTTSTDILYQCLNVQKERGAENGYGKERSFAAVATCFNAKTGKHITPAEVALILQELKDVRQWSQDRLHEDSVLDSVSYASLKAELLHKQYGEEK